MLNIKLYEDGPRLIISLENPDANIKNLVKTMLQGITGNALQIQGVAPVAAPEDKGNPLAACKSVPKDVPSMATAVEEQGFRGYCNVCEYYKSHYDKLATDTRQKLLTEIRNFQLFMAQRDIKSIPDAELQDILRQGAEVAFPKAINSCIKETACLTLEDFLASGRRNLEDAYKLCFPLPVT